MSKKIEISTLNISVNVLMLDNKRFTKSVYNQLPTYSIKIGMNDDFANKTILGYVCDNHLKEDGYSLLITNNGILERWKFPDAHYYDYDRIGWKIDKFRDSGMTQIFISC